MDDLKDLTNDVHYEAYRKNDLIKQGHRDSSIHDAAAASHDESGSDAHEDDAGARSATALKKKSMRQRSSNTLHVPQH